MDSPTNKETVVSSFSSFLPLCLLAASLIIVLGWQMTLSVQQYLATVEIAGKQAVMGEQAAQAESKLQAMMTDLLQLAKTDPEAKLIVTKYRVKLNADKSSSVPLAIPADKTSRPEAAPAGSEPRPVAPSATN